jgi:hypothetical protein
MNEDRWNWRYAVVFAVALAIGAAMMTAGTFKVREVKVPVIHRLTTTDTVYFGKPYAVRGPRQIIYRNVRPDTVLVTLPGRVDTLVQQFTRIAQDTTAEDSAAHRRLALTAGSVGRSDLRLYGFTNDGKAYQAHFPALRAPYQFTTVGDSVEVAQARIRFHLPSLLQVGACTVTGVLGVVAGHSLR